MAPPMRPLILLVSTLLSACAEQAAAPQSSTTPVAYPTFEPFLASRMAQFVFPQEGRLSASGIRELVAAQTADDPDGLTAGSGDLRVKFAYSALPVVMQALEPCWGQQRWSDEDVELAAAGAEYVALLPDAPRVAFGRGEPEQNSAALLTLVAWFEERVRDPAAYGAMIFTMDDGPWPGIEVATDARLTVAEMQTIVDGFELELCRDEAPSPWCLRAVRAGKPVWVRRLNEVPSGDFRFTGEPPSPLGSYGWKVHMSFGEYTHVYLGPGGEFLFYFTSW